jgi:hypothetical protein
MPTCLRSLLLLAFATFASSEQQQQQQQQMRGDVERVLQEQQVVCGANEAKMVFDLLLDSHPEEISFSLTCDKVKVFHVSKGSLQGRPSEWISRQYCASTAVKDCTLTITDASGDGLTDNGWYSLVWGATPIAIYDGSAFSSKSYCFGSSCSSQAPAQGSQLQQECKPVLLDLRLDSKPHEISFTLLCDGKLVWNVNQLNTPFGNLQLDECIQPFACCEFTIHDSGNDGLTAGNSNTSGYLTLEADFENKIRYDGRNGTQFGSLTVGFGNNNQCIFPSTSTSVSSSAAVKEYSVGAVVGSFVGGALGATALFALLLVFRRRSSDTKLTTNVTTSRADAKTKTFAADQLSTTFSDAEHSL